MPEQLTDIRKKMYVEGGYASCPNPECTNTGDFDSEPYEADDNWVAHRLTCNDCGCVFDDVYVLQDIQIIEDGKIS